MCQMETEPSDDERAPEASTSADDPVQKPLVLSQAELSVMHPATDDPDWRYFFGALHS